MPLHGYSDTDVGVEGTSDLDKGVSGNSYSSTGVSGKKLEREGVYGVSLSTVFFSFASSITYHMIFVCFQTAFCFSSLLASNGITLM